MDAQSLSARFGVAFRRLPGAVPLQMAQVDPALWKRIAQTVLDEGGRFITLWGTDHRADAAMDSMSALYCLAEELVWLRLNLAEGEDYPALCSIFPAAARMQRVQYELLGLRAHGAVDTRAWLNHGMWPADYFPLRQSAPEPEPGELPQPYDFVSVGGDGVHEIAVGPIHAGIIEPGHFRFSVVGEKVLRLEQRLGYTHKGSDKLFIGRTLGEGAAIAGRVSGDSTVAFALAYCMAAESVCDCDVPPRAQWLRVLLLERERIANHLGDLGALGNDAGLALGLSHFMRLKEDWLRLNAALFGHRLLMDCVAPGGLHVDLPVDAAPSMLRQCDDLEREVRSLHAIYEEHAGLQDRFIGAGRVAPKLAATLGLCGLAGRASAQAWDARADQAFGPYATLNVRMATQRNGDVAARVAVRFDELFESLRLIRDMVAQLPAGPFRAPLPDAPAQGCGGGWVEGWRGAVFVGLETGKGGQVLRCHCHDPSWQNWPVLQHAVMGNIVPDFPLINKSFNLSYSGVDL